MINIEIEATAGDCDLCFIFNYETECNESIDKDVSVPHKNNSLPKSAASIPHDTTRLFIHSKL